MSDSPATAPARDDDIKSGSRSHAAQQRHDRVSNTAAIDALRVADGTLVTVATLDLKSLQGRQSKVVSVRIKTADGRSLSVRLGPVNVRHFAVALARGIDALGEFDGVFAPRSVRPKTTTREWRETSLNAPSTEDDQQSTAPRPPRSM